MNKKEDDPIGKAIYEYYKNKDRTPLVVDTNITSGEELAIDYLFRTYSKMSTLEQKALKLVKDKILDVGGGAGAHSLYLQSKGFDVTAVDISTLSCEVMRARGLTNVICDDIWQLTPEKYDTLLFMMNGIGLVKKIRELDKFFIHIKQFLNEGGQIIMDSSDIKYMYEDDEGSYWVDLNAEYYGDLEYKLSYKNITSKPFYWLFVDYKNLSSIATKHGFITEKIFEDNHHQYLARLTLNH